MLIILGVTDAGASGLEAIAGAVGGQSSCSTAVTPTSISLSFGGVFGIGTTGNGISDCGLQGSIQDNIATKGPLTSTNTVAATVGEGSYTGSSSASSNYGSLGVAAHGNLIGVTNTFGVAQAGGFALFNDDLTFTSPTLTNGSSGHVVYTFTISGALTTPVPTPPFASQNLAELAIRQDAFRQSIFTATTYPDRATILGNPSYPGFTLSPGSIQGSGQFSTVAIPVTLGTAEKLTVGLAAVSYPATGATLDAHLNAVLSGIAFYDPSNNLLTNFSIRSASGAVYSANGVSSVPIPATVWLFSSMLAGLALMLKSQNRSEVSQRAG
jgi:hypothetical protein